MLRLKVADKDAALGARFIMKAEHRGKLTVNQGDETLPAESKSGNLRTIHSVLESRL